MRKSDQALRAKISQTPESKRRSLFVAILENNDENVDRLEEISKRSSNSGSGGAALLRSSSSRRAGSPVRTASS